MSIDEVSLTLPLPRFLFVSVLLLPSSALAHPEHGTGSFKEKAPSFEYGFKTEAGENERVLPDHIAVFDIVRFTAFEHRALHFQIKNDLRGTNIVGMSDPLALKATAAGQLAPRDVGRIFFDMWKAKTKDARVTILTREAAVLEDEQAKHLAASEGATLKARNARKKLRKAQAMLSLITAWQADPMDGLK